MNRFDNLEFDDEAKSQRMQKASIRSESVGAPIRDASYFKAIADGHFQASRFELALQNYSRALEDDHTLFSCWLGQVRALLEMGEYKEADLWASKALELFPEHPELLASRAVAAVRSEAAMKAIAFSDNAMTKQGVTPYVWLCRGEVLLKSKSKMADHCLNQSIAKTTDPDQLGLSHLHLARVLRRYKRYSKALVHAKKAVEVLPENPPAWMELGLIQSALGIGEAKVSLFQAVEMDRDLSEAKTELKRLSHRGLFGRMASLFRRILRR